MKDQVQNINDSWPQDWHNSFDLIHQRHTLAGAGPWTKEAVNSLTKLVKHGGWIQLTEAEQIIGKSDCPVTQFS